MTKIKNKGSDSNKYRLFKGILYSNPLDTPGCYLLVTPLLKCLSFHGKCSALYLVNLKFSLMFAIAQDTITPSRK